MVQPQTLQALLLGDDELGQVMPMFASAICGGGLCSVPGWHCLGEDGLGHRADLEHQPQAPEQPRVWGPGTVLPRLGRWEGVPLLC